MGNRGARQAGLQGYGYGPYGEEYDPYGLDYYGGAYDPYGASCKY
jgi:hypothetical protein